MQTSILKWKGSASCLISLLAAVIGICSPIDARSQETKTPAESFTLDITRFYHALPSGHPTDILKSFYGKQTIDGVPFQIGGQAFLTSKTVEERSELDLPGALMGIHIGHTIDQLCLIHHTRWQDAEGQPVAYISLNYADGTKFVTPIRYGVHIRDWYRLPSEEKEGITDPNTQICFRLPPVQYKSPIRLFMSKVANPFPDKVVDSIDFISAHNLSSYSLVAATAVKLQSVAPLAANEPERVFDGKLVIEVVDSATGKPIAGALVEPSMTVEDEGVIAQPFYTSSDGKGVIRYPVKTTSNISARVKKDGYLTKYDGWSSIPSSYTFRLAPGVEKQ